MPLHRPHTGIIYGSYLRFRFLKAIDEFPSFRATDFGALKWNCDTKKEQNEQTEHKIPKQHRDIQIIQGSGLPWSHQKDSKSPKYPKCIDI